MTQSQRLTDGVGVAGADGKTVGLPDEQWHPVWLGQARWESPLSLSQGRAMVTES